MSTSDKLTIIGLIFFTWFVSLTIFWLVLMAQLEVDGKPMCKVETNWKLQSKVELCND